MPEFIAEIFTPAGLSALTQVLLIDLLLAGDNAVAVGLAAAGLKPEQRKQAILVGLIAAVVLRIIFALIAVQLLGIIGLLLAGGLLLLWVCWKMWQDLRKGHASEVATAEDALEEATGVPLNDDDAAPVARAQIAPKSFMSALTQILIADVSMSLDNVLAVAGAAREHPTVLVIGLLVSIALMGAAATVIARLLHRYPWLGYLGLIIVIYVALGMIWSGHQDVVRQMGWLESYNARAPSFMDIPAVRPAGH